MRSKPLIVHETFNSEGEKSVSHKGDWDIGIIVDMMRLADHADTYVLVSGDGDYVEAIEYLQSERGIRVEAISAGAVHLAGFAGCLRPPYRPGGHPEFVSAESGHFSALCRGLSLITPKVIE